MLQYMQCKKKLGIEDVIPSDLSEESLNAANTSAMMVENQLCSTTRKNYERVLRYIVKFFQEKKIFAALDQTQSSLIFPMNKQHLIIFLGVMAKENDDGVMKTVSTITAYISAIKWGYRNNNKVMTTELIMYINKEKSQLHFSFTVISPKEPYLLQFIVLQLHLSFIYF
jgi:hypothetical protein